MLLINSPRLIFFNCIPLNTHSSLQLSCLTIHFVFSPGLNLSASLFLQLCHCFSLSLFRSPRPLMEHVFLCLPGSYAWDGKGAQPGDCVMFMGPSAVRFPALQDLVCHSGSGGPDTLPQLPLTTLLSLSHSSYRVFSFCPQVGFFFNLSNATYFCDSVSSGSAGKMFSRVQLDPWQCPGIPLEGNTSLLGGSLLPALGASENNIGLYLQRSGPP